MANITTYAANKIQDHMLGTAEYTFPATVYLALYKASPTIAGTQTNEVSGATATAYARQAVDFDAAVAGACDNTSQITFTEAAAGDDWGTISHWAIMDALTAGNMLGFGEFTKAPADPHMHITAGMQYVIPAGALDMSIPLT